MIGETQPVTLWPFPGRLVWMCSDGSKFCKKISGRYVFFL